MIDKEVAAQMLDELVQAKDPCFSREDLERIAAAIRALPDEWRPISEAGTIPVDEYGVTDRVLLGFPEGAEYRVLLAYKDPYYDVGGHGYYGGSPWVMEGAETIDLHVTVPPTHFMPLPAPPQG